jgi:hypothetical protein
MNDEEINAAVVSSLSEILNIASIAAELQATDEAAEEIYAMCDLVAAYFGIERAEVETIDNGDGSYTTRMVKDTVDTDTTPSRTPIPGSIRTSGKLKYRVVDVDSSRDIGDLEDSEDGAV